MHRDAATQLYAALALLLTASYVVHALNDMSTISFVEPSACGTPSRLTVSSQTGRLFFICAPLSSSDRTAMSVQGLQLRPVLPPSLCPTPSSITLDERFDTLFVACPQVPGRPIGAASGIYSITPQGRIALITDPLLASQSLSELFWSPYSGEVYAATAQHIWAAVPWVDSATGDVRLQQFTRLTQGSIACQAPRSMSFTPISTVDGNVTDLVYALCDSTGPDELIRIDRSSTDENVVRIPVQAAALGLVSLIVTRNNSILITTNAISDLEVSAVMSPTTPKATAITPATELELGLHEQALDLVAGRPHRRMRQVPIPDRVSPVGSACSTSTGYLAYSAGTNTAYIGCRERLVQVSESGDVVRTVVQWSITGSLTIAVATVQGIDTIYTADSFFGIRATFPSPIQSVLVGSVAPQRLTTSSDGNVFSVDSLRSSRVSIGFTLPASLNTAQLVWPDVQLRPDKCALFGSLVPSRNGTAYVSCWYEPNIWVVRFNPVDSFFSTFAALPAPSVACASGLYQVLAWGRANQQDRLYSLCTGANNTITLYTNLASSPVTQQTAVPSSALTMLPVECGYTMNMLLSTDGTVLYVACSHVLAIRLGDNGLLSSAGQAVQVLVPSATCSLPHLGVELQARLFIGCVNQFILNAITVGVVDLATQQLRTDLFKILSSNQGCQLKSLSISLDGRAAYATCGPTLLRSTATTLDRILIGGSTTVSHVSKFDGLLYVGAPQPGVAIGTVSLECGHVPGHFAKFGQCTACPAGFSRSFDQILLRTTDGVACEPCSGGSVAPGVGQATCDACPVGYYSSIGVNASVVDAVSAAAVSCFPCSPGSFGNGTGATSCRLCSSGQITSLANSSKCSSCEPGRYAVGQGNVRCVDCPQGYYGNSSGLDQCSPCPPGHASNTSRTINCTICEPGFYATGYGNVQCVPCAPGSKSTLAGAADCELCDFGSAQNSTGQASCRACGPGSYADLRGAARCTACGKGTYQSMPNQSTCRQCDNGKEAPREGMPTCETCAPGTITNNLTGFSQCQPCPDGTYNAALAAGSSASGQQCRLCPANCRCSPALGTAGIVSNADYFVSFDEAGLAAVSKCAPGVCLASSTCSRGRRVGSPLCNECEAGLREWHGHCVACDAPNGGLIFLFLLICFLLVCILHVLTSRQAASRAAHLKILMYFVQMGPLLIASGTSPLLVITELLSFNVFAGNSSCLFPASSLTQLLLGLMPQALALAMLACIAAGQLTYEWWQQRKAAVWLWPDHPDGGSSFRQGQGLSGARAHAEHDPDHANARAEPEHAEDGVGELRLQRSLHRPGQHQAADGSLSDLICDANGTKLQRDGTVQAMNPSGSSLGRRLLRYVPTILSIYLFTVTAVAVTVFSFLECNTVYIDGRKRSFIFHYPAVDCSSAEYQAYKPFIYFVLVLELVIIPLGLLLTLVVARIRHPVWFSQPASVFYAALSVMFHPFTDKMFFWEIWTLTRRTVLVAVTILYASSSDVDRLVVSTLLCVIFFAVHLLLRPFHGLAENVVESASLAVLVLLGFILLGMGYPLSSNQRTLAALMVLIPTLLMAVWVVFSHRATVKRTVSKVAGTISRTVRRAATLRSSSKATIPARRTITEYPSAMAGRPSLGHAAAAVSGLNTYPSWQPVRDSSPAAVQLTDITSLHDRGTMRAYPDADADVDDGGIHGVTMSINPLASMSGSTSVLDDTVNMSVGGTWSTGQASTLHQHSRDSIIDPPRQWDS